MHGAATSRCQDTVRFPRGAGLGPGERASRAVRAVLEVCEPTRNGPASDIATALLCGRCVLREVTAAERDSVCQAARARRNAQERPACAERYGMLWPVLERSSMG